MKIVFSYFSVINEIICSSLGACILQQVTLVHFFLTDLQIYLQFNFFI